MLLGPCRAEATPETSIQSPLCHLESEGLIPVILFDFHRLELTKQPCFVRRFLAILGLAAGQEIPFIKTRPDSKCVLSSLVNPFSITLTVPPEVDCDDT